MLAFFIFAVPIFGKNANASEIIWVDGSPVFKHSQNSVNLCPMGTRLSKFNMSTIEGEWCIWRYYTENSTRKCEQGRFKVENDNLMSSEVSFYTESNCNESVVEKTYYKLDPSTPGKFKSRKDASDPSTEGVVQIFDTDYDSFAVMCNGWIVNDTCSSVPVILVKNRTAYPEKVMSIDSVYALLERSLEPWLFERNRCPACSSN